MINMNEETFYEGGPAKSDLIINLLAGITILGLPFTFAAIVRALWLRYKITNKRITTVSYTHLRAHETIHYLVCRLLLLITLLPV